MEASRFNCPDSVRIAVIETQGFFFYNIPHNSLFLVPPYLLDAGKAKQQADVLQRYTTLSGRDVLEIGAGLAMNMIIWSQTEGANVTGIEPDGPGFDSSFKLARELAQANGLDPARIVNAVGEDIPFPDASFDIVYSANVLEHTNQPAQVLREALRVLRPGGVLQFVFPNYRSYFDGHYGVVHPPVFTRGFFPWYVKNIFRRDPAFAHTLRTELNVGWVKRQIMQLQKETAFDVLGFGDDLFLERMTSLDFAAWATLGRIKRVLLLLGNARVRRFLGRLIIVLKGWTPIVLTLRKQESSGTA